jgi:hypothetical protein
LSGASDLLEQAKAKRDLATHFKQIAPWLSLIAERALIVEHAEVLEREAVDLEQRAVTVGG